MISRLQRCLGLALCMVAFGFSVNAMALEPAATDPAAVEGDAPQLAALPTAARDAFAAMRPDPKPKEIVRSSHYWISNESRQDVFYDALNDTGGVFVGVGADQNYLMAAWARSEVLVCLDFDGAIPLLHQVYGALFIAHDTPAAFVAAWSHRSQKATTLFLAERFAEHPDKRRLLRIFKLSRRSVSARLRRLGKMMKRRGRTAFTDNADDYRWVRDLWRGGRVFTIRGDLTGDLTMSDLATAATAAGLQIRGLYLSNAEQYFNYGDAFRRNIKALPMDERSVVMHTLGWRSFGFLDGDYHYTWQTGPNFQGWLGVAAITRFPELLHQRTRSGRRGVSTITRDPASYKARR